MQPQTTTDQMSSMLRLVLPLFAENGETETAVRIQTVLDRYEAEKTSQDVLFEFNARESFRSEMEDIRKMFDQNVSDQDSEAQAEARWENVLERTDKNSVHILLTTGGPARGYVVFLDSDNDPDTGYYWYQDWFNSKRVFWLDSDELSRVCDAYAIGNY